MWNLKGRTRNRLHITRERLTAILEKLAIQFIESSRLLGRFLQDRICLRNQFI